MINFDEVSNTVKGVAANMPELRNLSPNQREVINTVAALSTQSVLEILERKQSQLQVADTNGFPLVFAEWAQQFTLKTHYDKFLAIMWYLREHKGVHEVTTTDVAKMYDKARWKKPANMADVFAKGAERVFFAECDKESDEGLKLWQLTATGHEHLMELSVKV